jgi:hypothetical protein
MVKNEMGRDAFQPELLQLLQQRHPLLALLLTLLA